MKVLAALVLTLSVALGGTAAAAQNPGQVTLHSKGTRVVFSCTDVTYSDGTTDQFLVAWITQQGVTTGYQSPHPGTVFDVLAGYGFYPTDAQRAEVATLPCGV